MAAMMIEIVESNSSRVTRQRSANFTDTPPAEPGSAENNVTPQKGDTGRSSGRASRRNSKTTGRSRRRSVTNSERPNSTLDPSKVYMFAEAPYPVFQTQRRALAPARVRRSPTTSPTTPTQSVQASFSTASLSRQTTLNSPGLTETSDGSSKTVKGGLLTKENSAPMDPFLATAAPPSPPSSPPTNTMTSSPKVDEVKKENNQESSQEAKKGKALEPTKTKPDGEKGDTMKREKLSLDNMTDVVSGSFGGSKSGVDLGIIEDDGFLDGLKDLLANTPGSAMREILDLRNDPRALVKPTPESAAAALSPIHSPPRLVNQLRGVVKRSLKTDEAQEREAVVALYSELIIILMNNFAREGIEKFGSKNFHPPSADDEVVELGATMMFRQMRITADRHFSTIYPLGIEATNLANDDVMILLWTYTCWNSMCEPSLDYVTMPMNPHIKFTIADSSPIIRPHVCNMFCIKSCLKTMTYPVEEFREYFTYITYGEVPPPEVHREAATYFAILNAYKMWKTNVAFNRRITEMVSYLGELESARTEVKEITGNNSITMEYQKGPVIGKGTFGVVHRCLNVKNGKFLALKVLKMPSSAKNHSASFFRGTSDGTNMAMSWSDRDLVSPTKANFNEASTSEVMIEIETLKRLRHPNVIRYYGCAFDFSDRKVSILMEYAPKSLRDIVDEHKGLIESLAQHYCKKILEGLVYLHGKNIIHRDLKAGNILVTDAGDVKVSDFGTAMLKEPEPDEGWEYDEEEDDESVLSDRSRRSSTSSSTSSRGGKKVKTSFERSFDVGPNPLVPDTDAEDAAEEAQRQSRMARRNQTLRNAVIGTPLFMAPELMKAGFPSVASDIWAFGCTLVEIVTGKFPYSDLLEGRQNLGAHRVMYLLVQHDKPPTIDSEIELSDNFRDFMRQCLDMDPLKRPTASTLLEHPFIAGPQSDPLENTFNVRCLHDTGGNQLASVSFEHGGGSVREDGGGSVRSNAVDHPSTSQALAANQQQRNKKLQPNGGGGGGGEVKAPSQRGSFNKDSEDKRIRREDSGTLRTSFVEGFGSDAEGSGLPGRQETDASGFSGFGVSPRGIMLKYQKLKNNKHFLLPDDNDTEVSFSVKELSEGSGLPEQTVAVYAKQVVEALASFHETVGEALKSLRSDDVVVGDDGQCKIRVHMPELIMQMPSSALTPEPTHGSPRANSGIPGNLDVPAVSPATGNLFFDQQLRKTSPWVCPPELLQFDTLDASLKAQSGHGSPTGPASTTSETGDGSLKLNTSFSPSNQGLPLGPAANPKVDTWALGTLILELLKGADLRSSSGGEQRGTTGEEERAQWTFRKDIEGENGGLFSKLSGPCQEFLKQCCQEVPTDRPDMNQLLQHQWMTGCEVDLDDEDFGFD